MDVVTGKRSGERGGSSQLITIGCHHREGAVADDLPAADHADRVHMDGVLADVGDVPAEIDRNADRRPQCAGDGTRGRALHGTVGASGLRACRCRAESNQSQGEDAKDESLCFGIFPSSVSWSFTNLLSSPHQNKPDDSGNDLRRKSRLLGIHDEPPSLFEQHSEAVLSAIKDGASIPDAARIVKIAAPTVKGWLTRGR